MAHCQGIVQNTSFPRAALESWVQVRLLLIAKADKRMEIARTEILKGEEDILICMGWDISRIS